MRPRLTKARASAALAVFYIALLLGGCISETPRVPNEFTRDDCLEQYYLMKVRIKDIKDEYRAVNGATWGAGSVCMFGFAWGSLLPTLGNFYTWHKYDGKIMNELQKWEEMGCSSAP